MPSISTGNLVTCLLGKLEAVEQGGDHRVFEVFDANGVLVARTKVSRGWRGTTAIGPGMVTIIARQLGITTTQLSQLVSCQLSRTDYLQIAGGS